MPFLTISYPKKLPFLPVCKLFMDGMFYDIIYPGESICVLVDEQEHRFHCSYRYKKYNAKSTYPIILSINRKTALTLTFSIPETFKEFLEFTYMYLTGEPEIEFFIDNKKS